MYHYDLLHRSSYIKYTTHRLQDLAESLVPAVTQTHNPWVPKLAYTPLTFSGHDSLFLLCFIGTNKAEDAGRVAMYKGDAQAASWLGPRSRVHPVDATTSGFRLQPSNLNLGTFIELLSNLTT